MLKRLPSLTANYEWCFSLDPALEQLDPKATPKQRAAHLKKLRVARETGEYAAITRPGESPTRFVLRPVPGKLIHFVRDSVSAHAGDANKGFGDGVARWTLVQLALREAINFDVDVELVEVPRLGTVASDATIQALHESHPRIITELSDEILRRASDVVPLS